MSKQRARRVQGSKYRMLAVLAMVMVFGPLHASLQSDTAPREQDFVITAYYSPLPDQCCYVKGGEAADKVLNGQGTHGADGTAVYAGMAAAPGTYKFGTRIELPGIGTVTVHDRGGAIQEQGATHRLDLWVGHGEEGLARALAFGVRRVRGTIYPVGSEQPGERLVLDSLPSPPERLEQYLTADYGILDLRPAAGDRGLSVKLLQEKMKEAGRYDGPVTGTFGEATQKALGEFVAAMRIQEPSDRVTERTAAYLTAAADLQKSPNDIAPVNAQSSKDAVRDAQKLLRFIGFYKGRTDGIYSDDLRKSILAFQQVKNLVGTENDPGAGRIGPITRKSLVEVWERRLIAQRAARLQLLSRVRRTLTKNGDLPERFLVQGMTGDDVRDVQQMLADGGYFPEDKINGSFGPLTQESLIRYQKDEGLIKGAQSPGAGVIGPLTLRLLRQREIAAAYRVVRGYGWQAL